MFYSIPIPMCFMPEAEAVTMERSLQPRRSINQEGCLLNVMFVAEFTEKHLSEILCSRRKQPVMEYCLVARSTAAYSQ